MHQSIDAESPQVSNLRCHTSLLVLLLFNGITWMLLGLALIYAIAVGDRPRYYPAAMAATPTTPPPPINDIFIAAAEPGLHESDRLRTLLDQGHPSNQLDAGGLSPLWHAVSALNEANARLLLERGADPNLHGPNAEPILVAALSNLTLDVEQSRRFTSLLLEFGADPDGASPYTGQRALHIATQRGLTACVRELLAWGAEPDAVDPNGSTALHTAVMRQVPEAITVLLENGADPDKADHFGQTPRQLAAPQPGIAELFPTPSEPAD